MRISEHRSRYGNTKKLIYPDPIPPVPGPGEPDPEPEPEPEDPTKLPPKLMTQEIYNNLEEFYVNYAGGQVDDAPFDKQYPTLPLDERVKLQEGIIKNYGITNPTLHASWITKNQLGPVFIYRTQRETQSKLYPGMKVSVEGHNYVVGTAEPCDKTAIHYFVLGSNGAQVDFMDGVPYSTQNQEQVEACNAAVAKMIQFINDGSTVQSVPVTTKVIYAETPILGDTFPEIVAEEDDKHFSVTRL